jgi:hypothetical protein
MEEIVDVQLHLISTSPLGGIVLPASRPGLFTSDRDRTVPTQKWAWCAPEQVWTLGRKEKSHPCRESKNDSSVLKPVA